MKLSVIIPALNEAENIQRCVQSAWRAGAAEVIVADGGSQDATTSLARQCNAVVILASRGRGAQQNAGAGAATGDAFLFLHADNWLAPDVGRQMEQALRRPQVVCGALRQRIDAPGLAYRLLERGNAERVRWLGLPYGDQAIFVRRSAFDEVGGFDEVPFLEDLLLMRRLRRLRWPVLLPGPVLVSPRRWQTHGIVRQTLRNWRILAAFAMGSSPESLAALYSPSPERP